ncbi:MAG: hypothetical protein ACFE0P_06270 [Oceanicaulis sp.]
MSRRDTAAAILIATAAAGVFALAARGQGADPAVAVGPDPYFEGAVELTGEIVAVEDQRFTLKDDQGRDFQIRAEGLRDIPRADNGDLDLDTGERVTVRGDSGSPMLNVNMVAATEVEPG